MKRLLLCAFCATVILGGRSYGEFPAPSLQWKGFASLREGEVVKGEQETIVLNSFKIDPNNVWIQEMDAGLSLESKFNNIATGTIGVGVAVCNDNTAAKADLGQTRRQNNYFYLSQADLLFHIRDGENTKLELDLGCFPYKYNSSVRNLGEYLFRSGTYPQYLITEIDFPMARLTGLRFGGSFWKKTLNFDILLTTNTEWTAIGDASLSALISYKPSPVIELGIGGSCNDVISAKLNNTTPLDSATQYHALIPGTKDSATYNYTFAGQKIMARFTLDPRQWFPMVHIFGNEDLKLYAEWAWLGVVDYPASVGGYWQKFNNGTDSIFHPYTRYDNPLQRMPIMVGFNFPAFKLLDVLSLEVEYFGNPYVNSTNSIRFDNEPVPLSSQANEQVAQYMNMHGDDIKWSVYAKRTFLNSFYVMGQAANDHIRWYRYNYTQMDGKEVCRSLKDWYFTFKFGYNF